MYVYTEAVSYQNIYCSGLNKEDVIRICWHKNLLYEYKRLIYLNYTNY